MRGFLREAPVNEENEDARKKIFGKVTVVGVFNKIKCNFIHNTV